MSRKARVLSVFALLLHAFGVRSWQLEQRIDRKTGALEDHAQAL